MAGVALLLALPAMAAAHRDREAHPSSIQRLVQRVVAATDHQMLVVMTEHAERITTYSDARTRVAVTVNGRDVQDGDVRGTAFVLSPGGCYTTTTQPFVGLTDVALTLLPESQVGPPNVPHVSVSYVRIGRRITWTVKRSGNARVERGLVLFDSHDRIIRSSSSSGSDVLSYPHVMPPGVLKSLPLSLCHPNVVKGGVSVREADGI